MVDSPPAPSRRRAIGALAVLAAYATPARALDPGAAAPPLVLPGTPAGVDLAALAGKVVYVDFWASWCTPCRLSFPWMNEAFARHRGRGFEIVAVNVDVRRADAERFLAATPAQFTVAFDPRGETPQRWQVKGMPTSVLVGRDGRVLWVHRGFRAGDGAALDERIAAALAAK